MHHALKYEENSTCQKLVGAVNLVNFPSQKNNDESKSAEF